MRGLGFHFPYIAGGAYTPGNQIYSPGEPTAIWAGHEGLKDVALEWPSQVPYLRILTNGNLDISTARPVAPVPNDYATAMAYSMFIGGFVGKSQG